MWSRARFAPLPAVTQPQQGRIRAAALLIANGTLDPQGIAPGISRELEELLPPNQASPCVRVWQVADEPRVSLRS